MPRSRPGALRAARGTHAHRRASARARELPLSDRLSPAASAEVHRTAGARLHPLGDLPRRYRVFLRRPGPRPRLYEDRYVAHLPMNRVPAGAIGRVVG
ncbi:hypothetical protein [Streptomyces virginiae]|uniref:hypothetical protein n=1 Tax=Streptomyces virginiae TaxID=1961 RepID=UPI0030E5F51A